MSPTKKENGVLPRPRFRMPLWAAFVVAAAAYAIRSAMRDFDVTPDLPMDAIVLCALIVVIVLVGWVRSDDTARDRLPLDACDDTEEVHDPES